MQRVWSREILRNCHRAMRPGARLLIVDVVIDSAGAGHYGCFLDLEMLVLTPRGRERTRAEFRRLLQRSGFRLRRIVATESYLSVVEAVRVSSSRAAQMRVAMLHVRSQMPAVPYRRHPSGYRTRRGRPHE